MKFDCRPVLERSINPGRNLTPFRYTIAVGEEGSAEVCGTITVRGHYFENGNIQLQTSKEVAAKTVTFSVSEASGKTPHVVVLVLPDLRFSPRRR